MRTLYVVLGLSCTLGAALIGAKGNIRNFQPIRQRISDAANNAPRRAWAIVVPFLAILGALAIGVVVLVGDAIETPPGMSDKQALSIVRWAFLIGGIALGVLASLAIAVLLFYLLFIRLPGMLIHAATRTDGAVAVLGILLALAAFWFSYKAGTVSSSSPATPSHEVRQ